MHMFRLGMEFVSTPCGYVVHSPHPVANSWNTTQATGFWYKVCAAGGGECWWAGAVAVVAVWGDASPSPTHRASHLTVTRAPPPPPAPACCIIAQLKRLYADSREDMASSTFVPATSFPCETREPEKWSFYRRRLHGGGSDSAGVGGGALRQQQQQPLG